MRVWVDLANSPHPLLFAPVARRLSARGHEVLVTARDHAQTVPLARERWPDLTVIGLESPGGRVAKARAIIDRVRVLRSWARDRYPDVALSHNSYAQIVAARTLRLPIVTAMDFEHQPANHLGFRLAGTVLVPEAFPAATARRQGATPGKLVRYPGLKESLYLGDLDPAGDALDGLGVVLEPGQPLVVARTPPSRAVYHRFGNPLFEECLREIDASGARSVVLARHAEQRSAIERLGLTRCLVVESAVDSRSLLARADFFLGAGGTMTREAALSGVPTVSVFAGEVPAVDRWLEQRGLLTRARTVADLPAPASGDRATPSPAELKAAAEPILERFVAATEAAA